MLIPHEEQVDVITPTNMLFIGGGEFKCDDGHVMMMIIIIIIIMTIVSVVQRLGWGVHDYTKDKALHEATKKHCMVKLGNY